MAFESGALDAALAAAVGDDAALVAELRSAFMESAIRELDLLKRARCDANWEVAAMRLKGLGASFGIETLVELADEALDGAPHDPVVVSRLERAIGGMNQIIY